MGKVGHLIHLQEGALVVYGLVFRRILYSLHITQKYGVEKNQQGTPRPWKRSSRTVLSWPSRRWFIPLASHNYGTAWQPVPRRSFLSHYSLPNRLPFQTTQGCVYHTYLSSKHKQQWQHLLGYIEIAMVTCTYYFESAAVYLLFVVWSEPGRSVGPRDC